VTSLRVVLVGLSWEDVAAHALVESKTTGIDVAAIVSSSAGLAIDDARVTFHDLRWR
jgi:hypothetical protein